MHATKSLVYKVVLPLQEHGNTVHVFMSESSGVAASEGLGQKAHCEMDHDLKAVFAPEVLQVFDPRARFSGQAAAFRHALDLFKANADPASYDLIMIVRHDLFWKARIDQLPAPADLRKVSFFSKCSGSNGDLSHCVMDLLVTVPGYSFSAFDGVASTGCCYAPGYRHGAGHGCYNQTVYALEADVGVLTDWRPKNSRVIQHRDMDHCPLGALAGAKWDTDEQEDVLPLMHGYADAAMGMSCAIPYVGAPASTLTAHFPPHEEAAGIHQTNMRQASKRGEHREVPRALRGIPEAATAALYETDKCRKAITKANRTAWESLSCCHVSHGKEMTLGHESHLGHSSPWKRALYVRNQKAGSTFLADVVSKLFAARDVRDLPHGQPHPHAHREGLFKSKHQNSLGHAADPSTLVYTAVRDPIATAVDAYLEITRRSPDGVPWSSAGDAADYERHAQLAFQQVRLGERAETTREQGGENASQYSAYEDRFNLKWRGMTCDGPRDALDKFASFLDALEARSPMGSQGFHVFPQALKIDFVLRSPGYDAIAKVEDMKGGMERIAAAAGVRNPSLPAANRRQKHTAAKMACAQFDLMNSDSPVAKDVLRRLCTIYAADYTCFGYELPQVCQEQ